MPYMSLFFDLKGDKGKYDYSNNNGNKAIMTMIINILHRFIFIYIMLSLYPIYYVSYIITSVMIKYSNI